MTRRSILLLSSNRRTIAQCKDALHKFGFNTRVLHPYDMIKITNQAVMPQMVITDLDSLGEHVQYVANLSWIFSGTPILTLTDITSRFFVKALIEAGASSHIVKPFTTQSFSLAIKRMVTKKRNIVAVPGESHAEGIKKLLSMINIHPTCRGYWFVFSAVLFIIGSKRQMMFLTLKREIYPHVAFSYGVNVGQVERNIRYILQKTNCDVLASLPRSSGFGKYRKMSCKEFLFAAAMYTRRTVTPRKTAGKVKFEKKPN